MWWDFLVVGIIILIITLPILLLFTFLIVYVSSIRNLEKRFYVDGKLPEELKGTGHMETMEMFPCEPDFHSDYKTIVKKSGIRLPPYTIIECKECWPGFNGDYFGHAIIEFQEAINIDLKNTVFDQIKKGNEKWSVNDNILLCDIQASPKGGNYWTLKLKIGSRNAEIDYGRT